MGAYSPPAAQPPRIGYEIDRLIEPHPIFPLIQRHAQVDDSETFEVFNMGIGFCYVVDPASAERTLAILKAHGRAAQVIGTARRRSCHPRPRACRATQEILAGGAGRAASGVIAAGDLDGEAGIRSSLPGIAR